jgi:hypothetical protein
MISDEERHYLYWLGSRIWTGVGHVVEIGPWLGGSTAALAAGMEANPVQTDRRLHAFDNFIWRDFMSQRASLGLRNGDSFRSHFDKNLRPYSKLLVTHTRSLPDDPVTSDPQARAIRDLDVEEDRVFQWPRDEPIEILFVDGAKSWNGLSHLLRQTGASLLPGASLIVCQDYKYWGAYWVPITMELLGTQLEIAHVLDQNTVSFRVVSPLDEEDLQLPDLSKLSVERGLSALDNARARLRAHGDAPGARILEVAKVRFLGHMDRSAEARRVFRMAERSWPANMTDGNLERTRIWLGEYLGEPVKPGTVYRLRRAIRKLPRKLRPQTLRH